MKIFKNLIKCNHKWHYLCDHKWRYLNNDFEAVNEGGSIGLRSVCWIFCPKCKKEKRVYHEEWERIDKKQKIVASYEKSDTHDSN